MKNIFKKNNLGFVALIFVIMISSLFIVSSVIIAMVNTSNNMANYQITESNDVMYNIDSCLNDALWQIASSTSASGNYSIAVGGVNCSYQISATADSMKTVTSTATTTSAVGNWNRSVVMRVNVASSPFFIQSYKDYMAGVAQRCGDGECAASESCSTCSADCGACGPSSVCGDGDTEGTEVCDDGNTTTETQTCGNSSIENGTYCSGDCLAVVSLTEACDDGNATTEYCGDSATQNGSSYCNSACSAYITLSEQCDDGNVSNTDACLNTCRTATCGDGYVRSGTETCDDGNTYNEACGDGAIQSGSYCDSTCSTVLTKAETCEFPDLGAYCVPLNAYCGMCSSPSVDCPGHESPASGRCNGSCVWASCTKLCCATCISPP